MSLNKDSINDVRKVGKKASQPKPCAWTCPFTNGSIFLPRFFVSFSSMEKEREKYNTDFCWETK